MDLLPLRRLVRPATPSYLRVIVTTRCTMRCAYCHAEGDFSSDHDDLTTDELTDAVRVALARGVRKVKFLGGEPLLRPDLPEVVRRLRADDPTVDLSVITAGAVPVRALHALFHAGLSRCNLSIHGFGEEAFARRSRHPKLRGLRDAVLEALLAAGRPLKLNYVYGGPADEADLQQLLSFAAGRPVVVNVLDDLGRPELSHHTLCSVLERLRGAPARRELEPDPHSLPTTHLYWADGLRVEIKDQRLGEHAPFRSCASCPEREGCREGIFALRLDHRGELRPCLRPGQTLDLRASLRSSGREGAARAWAAFEAEVLA